MSSSKKLHIALVGLGFGAEFVPIYQDHPDVAAVAICDLNPQRLQEVGDKFNVKQRFGDVNEVIQSSQFDAVHLDLRHPRACLAKRGGVEFRKTLRLHGAHGDQH